MVILMVIKIPSYFFKIISFGRDNNIYSHTLKPIIKNFPYSLDTSSHAKSHAPIIFLSLVYRPILVYPQSL